MNRTIAGTAGALVAGVAIALAAPAHPASAHPLGNLSVNQLAALDLYPDRVTVSAAVDVAELPTLQEKSTVDREGTGYAGNACAALARDFAVTAAGHRLVWTVDAAAFRYGPGSAGLPTSRLDCGLHAPADLSTPTVVGVANGYRSDRIGWRELTAVGHGVTLVDSPLPTSSVSGGLTAYPKDLLSSPLDVRAAQLRVRPGSGGAAAAPAAVRAAGESGPARWIARGPSVHALRAAGQVAERSFGTADSALRQLVAARHLGPLVGVLALLLALVLGAGHAALPGHGKTVMAAYLAGRSGRKRDALVVGATVTLTHTGGVLVLGLLLTTVAGLAGERVLAWLGVASGALVAGVGAAMLAGAVRRRGGHHHHDQHRHDHHDHDGAAKPARLATIGMGVAGGLVPSPSALVILLGAIGLGRTAFGVLLVLGYGLGMAATLTAAGLLLIRVRDRWVRRSGHAHRLAHRLGHLLPTGTAAVVLLVGLGLAGRALAGLV